MPSVLDSLLVVLDLLVELLQVFVMELVREELQRVLVVGAELVVPVELVSHSSFLNDRELTPPYLSRWTGVSHLKGILKKDLSSIRKSSSSCLSP